MRKVETKRLITPSLCARTVRMCRNSSLIVTIPWEFGSPSQHNNSRIRLLEIWSETIYVSLNIFVAVWSVGQFKITPGDVLASREISQIGVNFTHKFLVSVPLITNQGNLMNTLDSLGGASALSVIVVGTRL